MRVIDTFCFSEPYEKELFLLKLHLESPLVDFWVVTECAWTFQGQHKGLHLRQVMADTRFDAFRDRILTVSSDDRLYTGPNEEMHNFECEHRQRELAFEALRDITFPGDRVIVSDVDEAFDFSHPEKINVLMPALESQFPAFFVKRQRYWWDFDNRCDCDYFTIPVLRWSNGMSHSSLRARWWQNSNVLSCDKSPLAFEYSFCFPQEYLWRKLTTFSHNRYHPDELMAALKCNHWQMSAQRGEKITAEPKYWFKKVVLDEWNSPAYVRNNLEYLRTHNVDPNYDTNRREMYPAIFGS